MIYDGIVTIDNLMLKPMTAEDSELYRVLRNKYKQWFVYKEDISRDMQKAWYENHLKLKNEYMFSVYDKEMFIGGAGLYSIDYEEGTAEFGRIVLDYDRSIHKGYGVMVLEAISSIAQQLGLKKLYLEVFENNTSAMKTYVRSGFVEYKAPMDGLVFMEKELV